MTAAPDDAGFAAEIYKRLLAAYGYPDWRPGNPPMDELVQTILSQNTSDINSGRAFADLRARYESWQEIMDAPAAEVAAAIRAGGLAEQKAPRIQAALRRVVTERGEFSLEFLADMPRDEALAWLTSIDGVGPKTASIVLLFCFGAAAFPVDTHVARVSRRLGIVDPKTSPEKIQARWEALVPASQFYPLHLNLIRHGRQICRAPIPHCSVCTLNDICRYPAKTMS